MFEPERDRKGDAGDRKGDAGDRNNDAYGWIDRMAPELLRASRELVDGNEAARVSDEAVAQILTAAIRLYVAKSDGVKPAASQTTGAGNVAAVDQAGPAQPRSLAAKAIDTVKEVAKSAGDIFSRVPCLPSKGGAKSYAAPVLHIE